jgi:hypothetical protein
MIDEVTGGFERALSDHPNWEAMVGNGCGSANIHKFGTVPSGLRMILHSVEASNDPLEVANSGT